MRALSIAIAFSLLFTGCTATPTIQEFVTPDGKMAKAVKCNRDAQNCFMAASKSCNGDTYQVISSESHAGGTIADVLPGPVTWYGMTYVCGPSDGKLPNFPFHGAGYVVPNASTPTTTNCIGYGNNIRCTSY